jgi:hypothetical protein
MEDLSRVYLEMYESYEPMTPERQSKVDRQVQKTHKKENLAASRGDEAETNKQMQRRIAMQSRQKMRTEDVDLYDLILDYLLNEGFCDDEEAATVIMAHMSEDWREEILDEGLKRMDPTKVNAQIRRLRNSSATDKTGYMKRGELLKQIHTSTDFNSPEERKFSRDQEKANKKKPHLRARDAAIADIEKYGLR